MKVYVVMGNDYPDAVFSSLEDAEYYCRRKLPENKRIHWRAYEFVLDEATGEPQS